MVPSVRSTRRRLFQGVVAVASLVLAGALCAGSAWADSVKVAMVLPGSIGDGGWNQGAYEGLQTLGADAGFEVAFSENVAQAEMPQVSSSQCG